LPAHCRFLGLVKANAYGHGAVPVGRKLEQLGADMLAVACVAEAEQLRQGGVSLPILCLGQTPPELAPLLLQYDVTQTVGDLDTGKALSQAALAAGRRLKIHVKLDTGMGRLGFVWRGEGDNSAALSDMAALCQLPGLDAQGLFTHFADADGSQEYTMEQLRRYEQARQALQKAGISFQISHCAASAAMLNYPCTHMEMARPGIALYGYDPAPETPADKPELLPVMQVKSRIAAVREMPEGYSVSYGRTATLRRDSRLAVIPIGYGDGFPRGLSNRIKVRIGDALCPIVGRVCMDMCMVDVTDCPQVKAGDIAVVYDGELLPKAAEGMQTIVYELLCDLAPRIPRIYLEKGAEVKN
jgi:alanine racemase